MVRERGAVLVVSLVILLVITMIGVTSMSSATLEERMSGNFRDHQLAFESAESALREAEYYVSTTPFDLANYSNDCTNGLCFTGTYNVGQSNAACKLDGTADGPWRDPNLDVWAANSGRHRTGDTLTGISQAPRYIIEFRCHNPTADSPATTAYEDNGWEAEWGEAYRITAIGYGGSSNARVMLQSTYVKAN